MEYITSRSFLLPQTRRELANEFWFNLWRTQQWPYREIVTGDLLYWYEATSGSILWKSRIIDLVRFAYSSKNEVRKKIILQLGDFDPMQTYFVQAPERGYCLAYKVKPLQKLRSLKPKNLRFPQLGWLRVEGDIAPKWLGRPNLVDEVVLDDLINGQTLEEKLSQLNEKMAQVSPERIRSVVAQTVRKDTKLIKTLKQHFNFRCQFPECGTRIRKRKGGFYVEVAHIQPVRKGGKSVLGNLIVLCPNHHKEFDYGELRITAQSAKHIRGKLNGKDFEINSP